MEAKKINLCEILKDSPEDLMLYSPLFGNVNFARVLLTGNIVVRDCYGCSHEFYSDGTVSNLPESECCLFPSKDNRDWATWKNPNVKIKHFDPKTLKTFDKVLWRGDDKDAWRIGFCLQTDMNSPTIITRDWVYVPVYVIPLNYDTEHLVDTIAEAPEYYRYWED